MSDNLVRNGIALGNSALTIDALAAQIAELSVLNVACDEAGCKIPDGLELRDADNLYGVAVSEAAVDEMEEESSIRRSLAVDFLATIEPTSVRECLVVAVFAAERFNSMAGRDGLTPAERSEEKIVSLYHANLVTALQRLSGITVDQLGLQDYLMKRRCEPFRARAAKALEMATAVQKVEAAKVTAAG